MFIGVLMRVDHCGAGVDHLWTFRNLGGLQILKTPSYGPVYCHLNTRTSHAQKLLNLIFNVHTTTYAYVENYCFK